jgi:hypothetical protein
MLLPRSTLTNSFAGFFFYFLHFRTNAKYQQPAKGSPGAPVASFDPETVLLLFDPDSKFLLAAVGCG